MSEVVQQGLIIINQEFKGKEETIINFIKRYSSEKKKYQLLLDIQLQFLMESLNQF